MNKKVIEVYFTRGVARTSFAPLLCWGSPWGRQAARARAPLAQVAVGRPWPVVVAERTLILVLVVVVAATVGTRVATRLCRSSIKLNGISGAGQHVDASQCVCTSIVAGVVGSIGSVGSVCGRRIAWIRRCQAPIGSRLFEGC